MGSGEMVMNQNFPMRPKSVFKGGMVRMAAWKVRVGKCIEEKVAGYRVKAVGGRVIVTWQRQERGSLRAQSFTALLNIFLKHKTDSFFSPVRDHNIDIHYFLLFKKITRISKLMTTDPLNLPVNFKEEMFSAPG